MRVTLVSTLPFRLSERKPGLIPEFFEVNAAEREDISVTHLQDAYYNMLVPLADDRTPPIKIPVLGETVAQGLIDDYVGASLGVNYEPKEESGAVAMPGMFWIEGTKDKVLIANQHKEQVKKALNNTKYWFENLIKIGDDDWGKFHQYKMITDLQKKACKYLGLQREWNFDIFAHQTNLCPACKSTLHPDAIICNGCKCIIDMEKYKVMKDRFVSV